MSIYHRIQLQIRTDVQFGYINVYFIEMHAQKQGPGPIYELRTNLNSNSK